MIKYSYIEDRNFETGHGWRDHLDTVTFVEQNQTGIFRYSNKDDLLVIVGTHQYKYVTTSYFYIIEKDIYERDGLVSTDLRAAKIKSDYPDFQGHDDMENHFEFHNMTPNQVKSHLENMGIFACGEVIR